MPNSKTSKFALFRSYILLLSGIVVIGWEVVLENSERPTIIVAALLMMGISVPLNLDEKAKGIAAAFKPMPKSVEPPQMPVFTPSPIKQVTPALTLYQEALAREAEAHAATEAARLKEGDIS